MTRPPRLTTVGIAWILASSILAAPTLGAAAPRYSGTTTGFCDSPVLSGAFLQPGDHQRIACENATTARRSGIGTSSVTWGGEDKCGTFSPSTVTFTGDPFTDVAAGQVFRLGTVAFANGLSA